MTGLEYLFLLLAYCIGAFPTGYLVARYYGTDLTKQGSGNVGATNVARVLGKGSGLLVLLVDFLKGALGVVLLRSLIFRFTTIGSTLSPSLDYLLFIISVLIVAGHCLSFPPFLKGGKGVATSLGILSVIAPVEAITAVLVFVVVFALKKIVSLASLCAAAAAVLCAWSNYLFDRQQSLLLAIAVTAIGTLVVARHHANIQRLRQGTEPQLGSLKRSQS